LSSRGIVTVVIVVTTPLWVESVPHTASVSLGTRAENAVGLRLALQHYR
jgi:hypothetical protein